MLLTISCPMCGLFRQGLDGLTAAALLGQHQLATLLSDGDYRDQLDAVHNQAEKVLSA